MRVVSGIDSLVGLAADVCVVGSGPAGLAVAMGVARRGCSVVVLESGALRPVSPLSEAEIRWPAYHASTTIAAARAFGGTSLLWGGRCTPLDPSDFIAREPFDAEGWPIAAEDIAPFWKDAADLLGCAPAVFRDTEPQGAAGLSCESFERWSSRPNVTVGLSEQALDLPITVVLDATVIDFELNKEVTGVTGITVASEAGKTLFRGATIFVLAGGGLETTRLLLNVQDQKPTLFGGRDGPLGRRYMGHISGQIARVHFFNPADARAFDFRRDGDCLIRRRMTLDPALRRTAHLPNVVFSPANPPLADPDHRSGALSAAYLSLCVPFIARRFVSEPIRLMNLAGPRSYGAHLRNIVLDLPRTARVFAKLLRTRLSGAVTAGLFLFNQKGVYRLHYHAEQIPHPDNRITLAQARDRVGLRQLCIDFRFRREDALGIVKAHEMLDRKLQDANIGSLTYDLDPDARADAVLAQASDGFHQMGTTRMGHGAQDGIVDRDCRVFDFANLYIAGTSVFRTSGAANPTFPAVALALRLAEHLAGLRHCVPKGRVC